MKGLCCLIFLLMPFACNVLGQQSTSSNQQNPQSPPANYGQTIFSRSETTAQQIPGESSNPPQAANRPASAPTTTSLVSDGERAALVYRSYKFEIHLVPAQHSIAVHALMSVQNDSDHPLSHIALQLSSALHWEAVRINGNQIKFQVETVASDIDHTGQLTEAVVPLDTPLAAGATVQLDVIYSGDIQQSSERLLRLGAPADVAASSEWDQIQPEFTALRGFGNVIWFPVSTTPVLLGEGSQMFDSVGKWKLRESGAQISMHVLVEYVDKKPNIAFLNGFVAQPDNPLTARKDNSETDVPRVISFTLPTTTLGFSPFSFFVMDGNLQHFPEMDIYTRHGNESTASGYQKIADMDRPLVEQWLGIHPKRSVVLIDLPDGNDLPFETGNLLFLPLRTGITNDQMGPVLAHMLGHAYFVSKRPWLDEGVAQLMTLFWIEQRAGRLAAIGEMDSHRAALALAETSDPGADPGQSLINAWSDIYYRNKAVDVLWMLRDIAGDSPFASTLQSYDSAKDHEASYLQRLLEKSSQKNLEWFFDDWIYRDRGLPDLDITSAYSRSILTKNNVARNYLVSIDVQNDSFCSAEVPVTVESSSTNQTKRLLVPAHSHADLRMLLDSKPIRVMVNDGSVPEVRTSQHEKAVIPAQ